MAATKEQTLKEMQRLKIEYPGARSYSPKVGKTGYKFIFENVDLLESISILQKPTKEDSYFNYSDYVVQIDCGNALNANALIKTLNDQYANVRIDNVKTVIFEPGGVEIADKAIEFVKSLTSRTFSLRSSDREKMLSAIYSILSPLQLSTYTMHCLHAGDIEEVMKLNELLSGEYTYQIAQKLEKANRTGEAITYYEKVSSSDSKYTNAQYRLSELVIADTPEAKIKRFESLVRSGEQGIPHFNKVLLQEVLQVIDQKKLKSIVCDKKLDIDVIMYLAEQFDSLAAGPIVDNLCTTLHKVLEDCSYRPCVARYNLLLAKRLGSPEEIANNPVLQATFYNHCLVASLASKKFRANEILIEQMQKDLAVQPVTLFLTNVLKLSQESTAVLYHAAMALVKQDRPLLAACLLQRVKSDNEVFFKLAAKENLGLSGIVLANRTDMDRIGSCIDMCVSAGKEDIADSVAKIGANFEEKMSVSSASSSVESRGQMLELKLEVESLRSEVEHLKSEVESLKSQVTARSESRRKHHSSKTSSSSEHSMFSEKSRRSHHHNKESKKHLQNEAVSGQVGEEARQDVLSSR